MKTTTSILWFLLPLATALPAQIDCTKFLEQGKKAAAKENFELAMNSFNSARRCGDREMGELVDKEVTKLFNAINKKKEQAEKEKQRAEEQRKIAEQEKQRAEEQTKIAQAARDSVALILKKFEAANAEAVDALTREANNLIYHLDYDGAAAKLRTAANLNQPTASFKNTLAEVAFFWNEAGQTVRAADLLMSAKQSNAPREKSGLQSWLKKYAGAWYDSLLLRYYPDLLPVPGGDALIDGRRPLVSAFKMARTETTMWQYGLYCLATGKDIQEHQVESWGEIRGNDPAINVSWHDAALYANWLNEKYSLRAVYTIDSVGRKYPTEWGVKVDSSARGYRLPTELEWEYAARGGPASETFGYAGSNNLDAVAWYRDNSGGRSHPVKGKKANSLGLYDMSGNVWEWCNDWWADRGPASLPDNYRGLHSVSYRVLRGGDWNDKEGCRVAYRLKYDPDSRNNYIGFRLVFIP